MPELPEVETLRRWLSPLVGQTLLGLRHEDPFRYRHTERAWGRKVIGIGRRGKFLLWTLEGGVELVVHLGMTGGFRRERTPHTRAEFLLEGGALFFHDPRRLGRIWAVDQGNYGEIPLLRRLGPEPLGTFPLGPFLEGLRRSRKALKVLLLDQTLAAGLGNIYADEALFRAGLHPARPAHTLTEEEGRRLHEAIRQVLAEAIALGGSTLSDRSYQRPDGKPGAYQKVHAVYARTGLPCPQCQTPVARMVLGGRGTHFCPQCQR